VAGNEVVEKEDHMFDKRGENVTGEVSGTNKEGVGQTKKRESGNQIRNLDEISDLVNWRKPAEEGTAEAKESVNKEEKIKNGNKTKVCEKKKES